MTRKVTTEFRRFPSRIFCIHDRSLKLFLLLLLFPFLMEVFLFRGENLSAVAVFGQFDKLLHAPAVSLVLFFASLSRQNP